MTIGFVVLFRAKNQHDDYQDRSFESEAYENCVKKVCVCDIPHSFDDLLWDLNLASPFGCGLELGRSFKGRLTGFLKVGPASPFRSQGDRFTIVRFLCRYSHPDYR
jgi:hypothetical protein